MFKNYLLVAVRNLLRHKVYSVINILGLAIGMACCILILLFVEDEWRYDRFHPNADRIYRTIRKTVSKDGKQSFSTRTSGAMAGALKAGIPEVEQVVRVWNKEVWGGTLVRYKDRKFDHGFCLADEDFVKVFNFPLLEGDLEAAFKTPFSVVISEAVAKKFFEDEDPLGKMITVEDTHRHMDGDYTVTGILKDIPEHSSLQFQFLTTTVNERARDRWEGLGPGAKREVTTYVVLSRDYRVEALEPKLSRVMARFMSREEQARTTYHLQPLTEMHLYSWRDYGISRAGELIGSGDITYMYQLSVIGAFILLIACVNFMNLATARSANRAREVGMRKVVGANRWQVIQQFLGESILLSCLAFVGALILAELALPVFNNFMGKTLSLQFQETGLLKLFGIALLVGIVAGSYPAFFMSAFQPMAVLKGQLKPGSKSAGLRMGLVLFQFAASIFFIISTAVVYSQLEYIRTKDLGFRKQGLVSMAIFSPDRATEPNPRKRLAARYQMVKQAFLKHPNILKASASTGVPPWGGGKYLVRPEGTEGTEWKMRVLQVDEDFLATYEIELTAGREFSLEMGSDAREAFILNETAVRRLGWTDPVGMQFGWRDRNGTVIGVIKDFHIRSLYQKIGPMVLCMDMGTWQALTLQVGTGDYAETIAFMKTTWQDLLPDHPFGYWSPAWSHSWLYRAERRFSQMFKLFAGLTIFVACLGLFGLAAFTAEQRTREIGVRKVLGASVPNIILLLSRDFIKLIFIGNLIAWPMAHYVMNRWLQDFAYRIDLDVNVFLFGGILVIIIALTIVVYQAFKAATANPVDALRYE